MIGERIVPLGTEPTRRVTLQIEGAGIFDEFVSVEISRDMKDFAGSFQVTVRDGVRNAATFPYATPPAVFLIRSGPEVRISIDGELVLVGFIEKVRPEIDDDRADVTISGRDRGADMIDSAAAPDGPGEFRNVRLDEACRRIAEPYGIEVAREIDPGRVFARYPLELAETGLSAIEKGARQRHALVMLDGTGKMILTRTGGTGQSSILREPRPTRPMPATRPTSGCARSAPSRKSRASGSAIFGRHPRARAARSGA